MGIEGLNRIVSRIKQWVVTEISDHADVSDAHHSPYTDAEVDAIVATHSAISGAHHVKYTDVEAVTAVEGEGELDLKLFNSGTQPRAYVYDTGEVVIGNAAWTIISSWDTAILNVAPAGEEMWSATVNPSRLTVKSAGLYLVYGYGRWYGNATGRRLNQILINGVGKLTNEATASGAQNVSNAVIGIFALAVNDYIEIRFYQTSGGNLNLEATNVRTGFMAARLY